MGGGLGLIQEAQNYEYYLQARNRGQLGPNHMFSTYLDSVGPCLLGNTGCRGSQGGCVARSINMGPELASKCKKRESSC